MIEHAGGASYVIRLPHHFGLAFRMHQHVDFGIVGADKVNGGGAVFLMHVTGAVVPGDILIHPPGLQMLNHVLGHQLVGQKINVVIINRLDDTVNVRRGHAHVAQGLHFGSGIDVADKGVVGVLLPQTPDIGGGDAVGQRTAAIGIGVDHRFVRV